MHLCGCAPVGQIHSVDAAFLKRHRAFQINVTSDFICPWGYIGEKRLARAIDGLPAGVDVPLQWLPFELNPDMPIGGMDRRTYRSRKFGSWERSQAMDTQTVLAGSGDGTTFDYEAIKRTPNSFLAHRVSWLAQREGKQRAFVEAALKGYFARGRAISGPRRSLPKSPARSVSIRTPSRPSSAPTRAWKACAPWSAQLERGPSKAFPILTLEGPW